MLKGHVTNMSHISRCGNQQAVKTSVTGRVDIYIRMNAIKNERSADGIFLA